MGPPPSGIVKEIYFVTLNYINHYSSLGKLAQVPWALFIPTFFSRVGADPSRLSYSSPAERKHPFFRMVGWHFFLFAADMNLLPRRCTGNYKEEWSATEHQGQSSSGSLSFTLSLSSLWPPILNFTFELISYSLSFPLWYHTFQTQPLLTSSTL